MVKFLRVSSLSSTEYVVPLKLAYISTSFSFGKRQYHVSFGDEKVKISKETYDELLSVLEVTTEDTLIVKVDRT
jgi:hypothetical protein